MLAEVIAIGDELTSGQRLDTNSQWLSQRLGELGVKVIYHTTAADDLQANVEAFRHAARRADLVVCTGGLGPTADDLTRQAIAVATERELVVDQAALAHLESLFARRKRPMPERNKIQAEFPSGARVITNPHGTAPGIDIEVPRPGQQPSRIFALPGVPAEMREMWEATVGPAIAAALGKERRVIRHRRVKCFGVGESDLEQMLPDLIRRGREPSVGITVHKATITLRITSTDASEESCLAAMAPIETTIRDCLGVLVFGEEDDELEHAVVRLLRQRNETVAVAEMGTGGLMANWLSDADIAHEVFRGGTVLRHLGDRDRQAAQATSADAIAELADDCRRRHQANYGLAIGPLPPSDSPTTEPGTIHFALATDSAVRRKSVPFAGHPDILKERAAKQALNMLRLALLD